MSITKPNSTYRILPVERLDPPVLIEISHLAFATDTHTLFKMHEKGTTDMDTEMPGEMYERDYKDMERNRMIKAVDEKGQLVGFSVWRKWNFDGAHPASETSQEPTPLDAPIASPSQPTTPSQPLIDQLSTLTTAHLFTMIDRLNQPGTRTFFCKSLFVLPSHQSKGVGSALLHWVVDFADENGASCWIHLSDSPGGVKMLEKKGFRGVNRLEVDLDRYATKPREVGPREWGKYTFRYMRREAKRMEDQ